MASELEKLFAEAEEYGALGKGASILRRLLAVAKRMYGPIEANATCEEPNNQFEQCLDDCNAIARGEG